MSIKYSLKNLEKDYGPLTFADLLLIQRADKDWTQTKMAAKLKISKQKLCDFEKGRRLPSVKTVAEWAKKMKQPQESLGTACFAGSIEAKQIKFKNFRRRISHKTILHF